MGIFEIKKDKARKFRFNLKASNGQIILSSEAYESKSGCVNGIQAVAANSLIDSRYDRKKSTQGESYFTLKASNGQVIGISEMYSSEIAMENGIASVKKNAPDANVEDLT